MRARILTIAFLMSLSMAAHAAEIARAQPSPSEIDLGDGMSVHRITSYCAYAALLTCQWWEPVGLSFGGHDVLQQATTFARAPSGRIVAMTPRYTPAFSPMAYATTPVDAGVMFSDDRGATWYAGVWPDPQLRALAIAFDPITSYAVAVGEGGSIWSSEDHGATWRRRRSGSGVHYTLAWVRRRTVVIGDQNGALWLSRDGGFAVESLADRGARVEVLDADLRIVDRGRAVRIGEDGVLHRE